MYSVAPNDGRGKKESDQPANQSTQHIKSCLPKFLNEMCIRAAIIIVHNRMCLRAYNGKNRKRRLARFRTERTQSPTGPDDPRPDDYSRAFTYIQPVLFFNVKEKCRVCRAMPRIIRVAESINQVAWASGNVACRRRNRSHDFLTTRRAPHMFCIWYIKMDMFM